MPPVIDETFFSPRTVVGIVGLPNGDYEAHAMRGLLEALGCAVVIHWIGTPGDFLKVLGQGPGAPRWLLICGHGDDEKGYYLGEYADFIDTSMLRDQHLPADAIAPVVDLPGCTVISSACGGGEEAMGRAFMHTGRIHAYIGCPGYPNGDDMLVFLVNLFHGILRKKLTDRQAWQRAIAVTAQSEIDRMRFFHADGFDEYPQQAGSEG